MIFRDLFEIIIMMSLTCVGYHIAITQLVHHFTNKWPEDTKVKNEWLRFALKPIYTCVLCHSSVIGSITFITFYNFKIETLPYLIISVLITTWLNGILYGLFNKVF